MYFADGRAARHRRCDKLGRHDPERHAQGVHRAEGVDLPARAVGARHRRHDRVLRRSTRRAGTRCRSPATTSAKPARRRCRSWRSRSPTASATSQAAVERGLDVDDFAPRLSFFFDVHNDFFEEIAKFRAARRMWATIMRERFGAKQPRSWLLRTHAQTAGCSLTAQQPLNNVVRVAIQALAGGARRHAIAAHQLDGRDAGAADRGSGADRAAHAADHRRGDRRHQHRRPARRQLRHRGAHRPARARGVRLHRRASTRWAASSAPSSSASRSRRSPTPSYHYQRQLDRGEKVMVGVNKYQSDDDAPLEILRVGNDVERTQAERVRARKQARDAATVRDALAAVTRGGAQRREPDAADHRRGAGRVHGRRDLRRLPRGLRRLPRSRLDLRRPRGRPARCAS